MHAADDWYKTFFTGLAVEMWLNAMPAEATAAEAEFLRAKLQAPSGGRLLDVPCGGGRLSIALAGMGYLMTGVDISTDFLAAARRHTSPAIDWQQRDMTDLPWTNTFDGAFCFGNSFGYLSDDDNPRFLNAVAKALKPGARFVIDYPTVAENVLSVFQAQSSYQVGDIRWERKGRYDPPTGRIIVEHSGTRGDRTERAVMSQRIYTYRQMCEMLHAAGFTKLQAYSGMNDEPFELGKGLLLVAHAA